MNATKVISSISGHKPKIEELSFVLRTTHHSVAVSMDRSEYLWNHSLFNPNWPIVIFVSGWLSTKDGTSKSENKMYKAFMCRGNVNFVVKSKTILIIIHFHTYSKSNCFYSKGVDAAHYIDSLYTWSAYNTGAVGEYIGYALTRLAAIHPHMSIHLIGMNKIVNSFYVC